MKACLFNSTLRPGDRYQVVVHVDAATLAEDADVPAGTSPPAYAATGHPAAGADRRTRAIGSAAFLDARPTAAMPITSGTSGEYRLGLPIDSILPGNGASRKPGTVQFLF